MAAFGIGAKDPPSRRSSSEVSSEPIALVITSPILRKSLITSQRPPGAVDSAATSLRLPSPPPANDPLSQLTFGPIPKEKTVVPGENGVADSCGTAGAVLFKPSDIKITTFTVFASELLRIVAAALTPHP